MRRDSGCCKIPAPALHVPPRGSTSGSPCRVQWGGSRRQESLTITMLVIVIDRVFISAYHRGNVAARPDGLGRDRLSTGSAADIRSPLIGLEIGAHSSLICAPASVLGQTLEK